MTEADKLLAQCVLLERLLKDKLDDLVDEVKKNETTACKHNQKRCANAYT